MQEHTFSFNPVDGGFEVDINPKDLPGLEEKARGLTVKEALRAAEQVLANAEFADFKARQVVAAAPARRRATSPPTRPSGQHMHQATP
jgi:hypothetical protein